MRGDFTQMSLITPEGNGDLNRDLVQVREHYERAIDAFQQMTRDAEQGGSGAGFEAAKTVRLLAHATEMLIRERQRIDASLEKHTGVAGGYAIDFDAARSEVRRRMARLRSAGSGGDVSG